MPTRNGDYIVGFVVYSSDYHFYKQLQQEGRVKQGELSTFLRPHFRAFLETHRRNPKRIKPSNRTSHAVGIENSQFPDHFKVSEPQEPSASPMGHCKNPMLLGPEGQEGDIAGI